MLTPGFAMDWMFVPSPHSNVEILTHVLVLGGGAFGRHLGHEGGAFMKQISALIKKRKGVGFCTLSLSALRMQ